MDTVGVVPHEVEPEHEPPHHLRLVRGPAVGRDDVARLQDGIVLDLHVQRPVANQEELAVPSPARIDVVQQVVRNLDPLCLAAGVGAVASEQVDGGGDVPDHVISKVDVLDRGPRRLAVLVSRREEDGVPGLRAAPVVLEQVAVNPDVARVLQLEEVLHLPGFATPGGGTRDMVADEPDVARHEARNRRVRAAEQEDLTCRFQVVVEDAVRPRSVPSRNRLAVLADRFDVRDPGVLDDGLAAVERDASLLSRARVAVDVAAVEDQVARNRTSED